MLLNWNTSKKRYFLAVLTNSMFCIQWGSKYRTSPILEWSVIQVNIFFKFVNRMASEYQTKRLVFGCLLLGILTWIQIPEQKYSIQMHTRVESGIQMVPLTECPVFGSPL